MLRTSIIHGDTFNLKVVLCGRRNTFASFAQDELQLSWQAQHFGDLCRHFVWYVRHFRPVALPARHYTLYIPHFHTPPFTLDTPNFTLHSLQSALHTLYTLHPHFTLHTFHSTLCTPHFTLHTVHSAIYSTLYTPHFALHTPHFTLYNHCPVVSSHSYQVAPGSPCQGSSMKFPKA